ncbi:MAG: phosphate ABC transporter substrate-binding/OmpA family protein [Planctomycetota bacterium]
MSKAKIVLACFIWLVLLGIGAGIYRLWLVPSKANKAKEEEQELVDKFGSDSQYDHQLSVGIDAFSGYAILRSPEMKSQLRGKKIQMKAVDDGANYAQRLKSLQDGDIQLAAFPIDALLKSSAELGGLPATIIAIIDETAGADAIVAYKQKFPSIESLNQADTKFVLVGDSPSETLARLVLHTFDLDNLSENSILALDSEKALLDRYRAAKPNGNEVFVTWEPVVSQMVGDAEIMHTIYDSSQQSGVIVDALVVSRDYLRKNETVVEDFLESYLRARHAYSADGKLKQLIVEDARTSGASLTDAQADKLASAIVWKNTQDNLAHFGLRSASVTHIEDMIDRIQRVLTETGGLVSDPTKGRSSSLFYDKLLISLQTDGFYPGASTEQVQENKVATKLSESQWGRLQPIGKVAVPPLIYPRGSSTITESSRNKLDDLMKTLETFPRAYLMVRGDASSKGDAEANKKLARQRAEAALQYLVDGGVDPAKVRAVEGEITGQTSVTFVLAELPY